MHRILVIFLLSIIGFAVYGQGNLRAQMESEREGSFQDPKTYEKARKFIRMDSSYYLGYLLEGAYLYYRANDELGYNKAIPSLRKALQKIEKDYDEFLRTRSNSFNEYAPVYKYHFDYGLITNFLISSYQNVELQDKAMEILGHIRDRNFQLEINQDSYNTMAWIFHRNRMYTSARFPFLKNSVMANVRTANRYLDSALMKIENDFALNNGLFDPRYLNGQYLSTFHYKAIIYDYLLDIDSANYYYDILIQNNAHSSNNYAEFKLAMGEFEEADLYFQEAEQQDNHSEKNTKEYYYMRGTLNIYRGHPEEADTLLTNILKSQGSTPGYGWHAIGLARAKHFEGLTAESQEYANKAGRFQELHIGTTWGPEHYNLAVASLNYINQVQFQKEFMFENDEWYFWLNPMNWYRAIKHALAVRHHKMVLVSLVAENPEREQVLYTLFSPENLITFDEVWSVIEGFGNEYFIDIYKKRAETDKRPQLRKYFLYVLGKLYLAEGEETEAKEYFRQALSATLSEQDPYETLLTARLYEGLAMVSSGDERTDYIQRLYKIYPQLVPFTDLTMSFRLTAPENVNDETEEILDDLKDTNIDFEGNSYAPHVSLGFTTQGDAIDIHYKLSVDGDILDEGVLRIEEQDRDHAGELLAYHLFRIHKTDIGDELPATPPAPAPVKEEKKQVV
jgi:tetratricopeptide (TPR) repeat protein